MYRGPRYQDHNNDDIDDSSGSNDLLDFSQLDYAIVVDLASTSNQDVERRPWWTYEIMIWSTDFNSRVGVDLKTGSGSTGIENVRGTEYNDRIYGNELDNELWGLGGNDWIYGRDGSDRLLGGYGDDVLRGGNARDYLFGEWGRDQLLGEAGDDYLHGGYDNSADVLNGGVGADQFVRFYRWNLVPTKYFPYLAQVYQLEEGEDLVDFNSNEGDSIVKQTVFWSW